MATVVTAKGVLVAVAGAALVATLAGYSGVASEQTSRVLLLLGAAAALTLSRSPRQGSWR